jgi:hypothetical protein
MLRELIDARVGAWFTALTNTWKLCAVVAIPSFTITVIVAMPEAYKTGVKLSVAVLAGLV